MLRSLLVFRELDDLCLVLGVLGIWLVMLVSEPAISRKWPFHKVGGYFSIYLIIQTSLICTPIVILERKDFLAILFAILSLQAMQRFSPRVGGLWIGLFAPVMILSMIPSFVCPKPSH